MTTNYQSITKLISPNDLPLGIGNYLGDKSSWLLLSKTTINNHKSKN